MHVLLLSLRGPDDRFLKGQPQESHEESTEPAGRPSIYLLNGSPEEAVRLELDGPLVAERWSRRDFGLWESVPELDFETPTWLRLD